MTTNLKMIEKNFADFSSQDELETFIQDAFDEKTSKYNKNLKQKEKSKTTSTDGCLKRALSPCTIFLHYLTASILGLGQFKKQLYLREN